MIKISKIIYDNIPERPQCSILQLISEPYPTSERTWVITEELNLPYIEGLLVGVDKHKQVKGFEVEEFPLWYDELLEQLEKHPLPYRLKVDSLGLSDVTLGDVLQKCYTYYSEKPGVKEDKVKLLSLLDELPEERISELLDFAEFLKQKESIY